MRRVAKWVLAFLVASAVGFGGLVGVGCLIDANICPWNEEPAFTSTVGSEIYVAKCLQCHGPDARGKGQVPSLITGKAASLSLPELTRKIEKGRPFFGMPAFGFGTRQLTPEQIDAVARYVFTLRGGTS